MMKMGRFRSSTSKPRSHNQGQCKKHPKHRQSPGVCSLCLTEKLSRVSNTSLEHRYALSAKAKVKAYYCSSSSVSSSDDDYDYDYDDDDDDSCVSSPGSAVRHGHYRRIVSDVRVDHIYYMNSQKGDRFGKSRSMAYGNNNNKLIRSGKENKKRVVAPNMSGFWSKLLGPKRSSQHLDRSEMIYRSQPLASSSSMAVY